MAGNSNDVRKSFILLKTSQFRKSPTLELRNEGCPVSIIQAAEFASTISALNDFAEFPSRTNTQNGLVFVMDPKISDVHAVHTLGFLEDLL
jgi:hypothetical protein